ncbi:hypothetical protein POVCU1_043490, partial [Plasmodium ovale curtisi]
KISKDHLKGTTKNVLLGLSFMERSRQGNKIKRSRTKHSRQKCSRQKSNQQRASDQGTVEQK